jgi:predicted  nucleic acid-binding Zn-ribbon protein
MSKGFLVNGRNELRGLEKEVEGLESDLGKSREDIKVSTETIMSKILTRYRESKILQRKIGNFLQPADKLHEAIIHASRNNSIDNLRSLADALGSLSI